MADENQIYYDMQDNAAAIDNVVHDLIQTLKEEDVNKGIFVAKDGDESAEVKFHLIAKDMKSTIDYFMGGGNENEILVGDENNRIKGSDVYFERSDAGIEEQFNADTINLKGNSSHVSITPTQFIFSYNSVTDENEETVQPDRYSSLYIDPDVFSYSGKSNANTSSFSVGPGSASFSGKGGTYSYTGFITNQSMGINGNNSENSEDFYNLSITPNSITVSNNGEKHLDINSERVYFKKTTAPLPYTSAIDMRGISKFFMSNDVYPLNGTGTVSGLTSNEYSFNMNSYTNYNPYGSQLLIDDSGAAFIRGCAKIYLDSQGWSPYNYTLYDDSIRLSIRQGGSYIHKVTSGPAIAAQGCPFVYFNGSPIFCVNDNARVIIDQNSRFTMHGCAKIDITGREIGNLSKSLAFENTTGTEQVSPRIFIHNGVQINIDNGYYDHGSTNGGLRYDYDGKKRSSIMNNYNPNIPELKTNDNIARILIHDSPTVEISKGAYLRMSETALIDSDGNSTIIMRDNGYLEIADNAIITARDNASFTMDRESLFKMSGTGYSPVFSMNGPACFKMQSARGHVGPLLLGETDSLIFLGDGMSQNRQEMSGWSRLNDNIGTEGKIGKRLNNLIQKTDFWGNKVTVGAPFGNLPDYIDCPALKIGGYVTFNLDSEHPGGVYVQMGNGSSAPDDWGVNVFLQGDTYIKTGEHNHIELHGGWVQTTGNPHTEVHDNTHFVFRGNLTAETPWLDGLQWGQLTTKENGTITWKNFNSARCVTPIDSPVIQLYDSPNFYMRGYWEDTTETPIQKERNMYFSNESQPELFEEISNKQQDIEIVDMSEELRNYIIDSIYSTHFSEHSISVQTDDGVIEKYITNRDIFEILSIDSYVYTWINSDGDRVEITVNYTIKNLTQEGWTNRAIKAENSPVLEIIENADVRVSGNAIFNVDNTSLTIGNNEKTVTFTFEQLEQLKQLLS